MPHTSVNTDVLPVDLGSLERQILRNALNAHQEELEKAQKKDKGLGVPNPAAAQHLACITGEDGWGKGLYAKLGEQTSLLDEMDAVERAVSLTLDALAAAGLDVGAETVRGWTAEQRGEVQAWAPAHAALLAAERAGGDAAAGLDADVRERAGAWPRVVLDTLHDAAEQLDAAAEQIARLCPMASVPQVIGDVKEAKRAVRWAVEDARTKHTAGVDTGVYSATLVAKRTLEKHFGAPL